MKTVVAVFGAALLVTLAFGMASASPAAVLSKAITRFFSKQAATEGGERLSRELGAEVIERVSGKLLREGGDSLITESAELASRHGPEILRALDNAPAPGKILGMLKQLPESEIPEAAARLASGSRGKALAAATEEFGADVLRSEIRHPGIGLEIVRTWPKQGNALCRALQRDEAITLGKYLDDLSTAPLEQRNKLQEIIAANPNRFFAWLRDFIEKNPGKSIGSVTFLAAFLPNSERILGGDEIAFDENGQPVVIRKPGLISASMGQFSGTMKRALVWLLGGGVALVLLWLARFLGLHRGWITRQKRS